MADPKLIMSDDLKKIREVDFVSMFGEGITKLMELLGTARMIEKPAGTVLKMLKVTGTLENGTVAEGEDIPLSKYATTYTTFGEITLKKWAKATTIEAIQNKGFNQAVTETSTKMLRDVQKGVRTSFITALGQGGGTASGVGIQGAVAKAWAKLQAKFEDDAIQSVYFVNPEDIADYLASAQVTTQTAFGFTYLEDFLGMGTVIINKDVPAGTVYATASENIICYYINAKNSDIAKAFDFETDETGLIGIHESSNYDNLTSKDTVICGVQFLPEMVDGVIVSTINAG